ncbi:MAG: phosphatase PAP2 family protein [Roseburia sp.]
MKQKIKWLPRNMWLSLILAVCCNSVTYYGTRVFTNKRYHYNLSNQLDDQIPFIPWTVAIYLGCYVFWILNYILGCRQKPKVAFRFMSADFVAKIACMVCFFVFPTTNVRPIIEENSLWESVMAWLYRTDAADNLLPSIHCLTSWFCVIAVRENKRIPRWYKMASIFLAFSVCVSTLTTKQHVLIDVVCGIALAEGSYLLVEKSGFSLWYADCISKISSRMQERRKVRE